MHIVKKQTTAFSLLLLTALPLLFAVGIVIKQTILQQHRRERFKTEKLETIKLPSAEIVWLKEGKEILHEGKLFDVKSFKTSGIHVELIGFYDHNEDKLVKKLKGLIEHKKDGTNLVNQLLVKFLFYPKTIDTNIYSFQNNWAVIKQLFPVYSEVVTRLVFPAPTPPPKFC